MATGGAAAPDDGPATGGGATPSGSGLRRHGPGLRRPVGDCGRRPLPSSPGWPRPRATARSRVTAAGGVVVVAGMVAAAAATVFFYFFKKYLPSVVVTHGEVFAMCIWHTAKALCPVVTARSMMSS